MGNYLRYQSQRIPQAFTLPEMITAMALSTMIVLAVGVLIVDQQKGYTQTFNRAYSGIVTDAHLTAKAFDSVCRKATLEKSVLTETSVEVYYFQNPDNVQPDHFARFYQVNGALWVDYGQLKPYTFEPLAPSTTLKLAGNVENVDFSQAGNSIVMALTLDGPQDNLDPLKLICSALRHNE